MNTNNYAVTIQNIQPLKFNKDSIGGEKLCAFTIDVEDWYQSSIDFDAPITKRVIRNVELVLATLDKCGIKGTFFIQGRVAETFPHLIRRLVHEGHEVQSHGYSHRPLTSMDHRTLRDELERARKTVEDASGVQVTAFRAPDFTISSQNLWALEILSEMGFEVDSSIFPIRMPRYGISGWEITPHRIHLANGSSITEVPVAVWAGRFGRLPVAGGGYLRLLPLSMISSGLNSILSDQRPVVLYVHPYEFNPDEMGDYINKVPWPTRFSQDFGRKIFTERIQYLVHRYSFGRFDQILANWNMS